MTQDFTDAEMRQWYQDIAEWINARRGKRGPRITLPWKRDLPLFGRKKADENDNRSPHETVISTERGDEQIRSREADEEKDITLAKICAAPSAISGRLANKIR